MPTYSSAPASVAYEKAANQPLGALSTGMGYAPEGWRHLAGVFPDYQEPLLVESGLVIVPDQGQDPESASESAGAIAFLAQG